MSMRWSLTLAFALLITSCLAAACSDETTSKSDAAADVEIAPHDTGDTTEAELPPDAEDDGSQDVPAPPDTTDTHVQPDVVPTDLAPDAPQDLTPDTVPDTAPDTVPDTQPDTQPDVIESCQPVTLPAPRWVVAPNGRANGAGTLADPLDLPSVLRSNGPVSPGDRVMLRGGTYVGRFTSAVVGTAAAPIVFYAEPGARVIFDSNASSGNDEGSLIINGAWVEFHGMEFTDSHPDRLEKWDGVVLYGANTKLVNAIIYDTAQGVGFWRPAIDAELYGNIIFNNGFQGTSRGHGHAIYTQNQNGTKRITQNIIFFGYGYGIHAYTEGGYIQGFDIVDNVWFRAGASVPGGSTDGEAEGCLVGGLQPVARTRLAGNHSWGPRVSSRSTLVGWGGSVQNVDITMEDNYFVGRVAAQGHWQSGVLTGNHFYSSIVGIDPADFPNNVWSSSLPTGTKVVIQRNRYDAQRADLIIYNWGEADSVSVDLSAHLAQGSPYSLYSVFDLWSSPVASGVYQGGNLQVPMGTKAPPQPQSSPNAHSGADDPGKAFGVFVLRAGCALR